ncbi:RluA family pseudouridine synthase [Flavobacteriales bacterium]|nr:RluA family pseudouridine synthase [Flavobacteriales bacterium]
MSRLEVLYEDNHIIAINKKSGDLSQGDKTGDNPLSDQVKAYIKQKYNKPGDVFLGVVHRLDRPVTGVILFARTSKALTRLNEAFRKKEMQKTYWAISRSTPIPAEKKVTHYLLKNPSKNKTTAFSYPKEGAKESTLIYKTLECKNGETLIEVSPLTGRPHQIRVQLSQQKAVIKGDIKYGDDLANPDQSICLHARSIQFTHPVKKEEMTIRAPLPRQNWKNFS